MVLNRHPAALVGMLCIVGAASGADPFVYQGVLEDGGAPADGVYDLIFETYDTPSAGTANGFYQAEDVTVENGLFEVEVNLSNGVDAGFRWLQIAVRDGASTGGFTVLGPRQFLDATPFASVDLNEPWTPSADADLHTGDGDDIVLINRDTRIGSEFFGIGADTSGFGGMYINTTGINSLPFYGYATQGGIRAYHYYDPTTEELIFNVDGLLPVVMDAEGLVTGSLRANGISYKAPQTRTLTLGPEAFRPRVSEPGFVSGSSDGRAFGPAGSTTSMVAPLNLPEGAVIDQIRFYHRDTDPTGFMQIQLRRVGTTSITTSEVLGVAQTPLTASSFTFTVFTNASISDPTIKNTDHSYALWIAPSPSWTGSGNTLSIRGVEITYTVTEPD